MELYLVVLIYYISLLFLNRILRLNFNKIISVFLLFLPLVLLVALRAPNVGNDTFNYYRAYNVVNQESFFGPSVSRLEIGYVFIARIIGIIGLNYFGFQILTTVFIYYSITRFICKYSSNPVLSAVSFITLNMFFQTMNISRQYLAIGVLLFSVDYILSRKPVKFFALVVIASLIHSTAIFFLVLYPLSVIKMSKFKLFHIISGGVVLSLIFDNFVRIITSLIGKYQGYLESQYFQTEGNIAVYINLFIYSAFLAVATYTKYGSDKRKFTHRKQNSKENINLISIEKVSYSAIIIIFILGILGLRTALMPRFVSYFLPFLLILIADIFRYVRNKYSRIILFYLIGIGLVMYFVVIMIYRPEWTGVIPYLPYWGW